MNIKRDNYTLLLNPYIKPIIIVSIFFSIPFGLNAVKIDTTDELEVLKKYLEEDSQKKDAMITKEECRLKCLETNQGKICSQECEIEYLRKIIQILESNKQQ